MKVDELIKHLENIKTDENKIDERREIAKHLAQTFGDKERQPVYHFMTKDRKIYDFDSYVKLFESNKISSNDAYVYVENEYFTGHYPASYFYPFLVDDFLLPNAYLSKLGLESDVYRIAPATELKYVAVVYHFPEAGRTVVEVVNIDNAAINTNLPILIFGGVRNNHIDDDEVKEIVLRFSSRELFAGYDFSRAEIIIRRYYEDHDISLAEDVAAINYDYTRILQPYRVEYDLKTKQIIASFERKLF